MFDIFYIVLVKTGVKYIYIYLCITCVPGALRGQKRVLDPLKLELRMVVSHCVCWELNLGPLFSAPSVLEH